MYKMCKECLYEFLEDVREGDTIQIISLEDCEKIGNIHGGGL